jgi:anti-sigma B factor antagonist
MTATLQITTGRTPDGTQQLTAIGEIDLSNSDELRRTPADAVSPGQRLLVDLTRVSYLDSSALAALFIHAEHIDIDISPLNESLLIISGLAEPTTVRVIPPAS